MLLQVTRHNREPLLRSRWNLRGTTESQLLRDSSRKRFDFRGAQRQPVVGARSRHARRGLYNVQPVHRGARAVQLATFVKLPRVPNVPRTAGEKIRIERQNDVRFSRTVNGVDVSPERQLRAFARAVAYGWLPMVPFGQRVE